MARPSTEIMADLGGYQKILYEAMKLKGAIYCFDLDFVASQVRDLKQELRIAQASER